jgi:arylsulfatase A-like enzyme
VLTWRPSSLALQFIVTTDNGGPTTECSTTGQSNWPLRGSKCSIWDGGTRGTGFLYWSGLPSTAVGLKYTGLIHAADWLPTVVSALTGASVEPKETLPLDGIDMWAALTGNHTSPRTHVYYGIAQGGMGPALRDVAGVKLIVGTSGGGKGEWSPQQLPNQTSTSLPGPAEKYLDPREVTHARQTDDQLVFNLASDPGEHTPLSAPLPPSTAAAVATLLRIRAQYAATAVPQAVPDPSCPKFTGLNTTDPSGNTAKYIGPWCD